jgi:hypothetical protein
LSTASASWQKLVGGPHPGIVVNEYYEGEGEVVFQHACALGCEGIVSKRLRALNTMLGAATLLWNFAERFPIPWSKATHWQRFCR